jgi:hypothetical protein
MEAGDWKREALELCQMVHLYFKIVAQTTGIAHKVSSLFS